MLIGDTSWKRAESSWKGRPRNLLKTLKFRRPIWGRPINVQSDRPERPDSESTRNYYGGDIVCESISRSDAEFVIAVANYYGGDVVCESIKAKAMKTTLYYLLGTMVFFAAVEGFCRLIEFAVGRMP